eukprot:366273-Chlamydomonas_euryale.AAC.3
MGWAGLVCKGGGSGEGVNPGLGLLQGGPSVTERPCRWFRLGGEGRAGRGRTAGREEQQMD